MPFPVNHELARVYRPSAAIAGCGLIAFGVLGFLHTWNDPWTYYSEPVLYLATNNIINLVSVVVGAILIAAAAMGGNAPAYVDTAVGLMFMLNGLFWLAWLRTPEVNVLHFTMTNVIFSFIAGTFILTCGLYGRVSVGTHGTEASQNRARAQSSH